MTPSFEHPIAELQQHFFNQPFSAFSAGHWQGAESDQRITVLNPASNKVLGQICPASFEQIDAAVVSARQAFDSPHWGRATPSARTRHLLRLADLLERDLEVFALIETLDNGMPITLARRFVAGAVESIRYNAGWASKINGSTHDLSAPGEWHAYSLREAIGVVGQIVPWNVPLAMAVGKISSALAAGCTVVLKPAELTPYSAARLGLLLQEAEFPPGVVNIVNGRGVDTGNYLVEHPGLDKISFTGSTQVGKGIAAKCAASLKRVGLELGGKSPVFVFPDADLEQAAAGVIAGIFTNSGQVCAAGSRLYMHADIAEGFVQQLVTLARQLKVGDGLDPATQMGPLISATQLERVQGYVDAGLQDGARLLSGGRALEQAGNFMPPTILTDLTQDMGVVREEIFGPVLCAMTFSNSDPDHLAGLANATAYGLSANIWSRDLSRAHTLARRISSGSIKVNAAAAMDMGLPFGGFKASGLGRENGREGVEQYTEVKVVAVKIG